MALPESRTATGRDLLGFSQMFCRAHGCLLWAMNAHSPWPCSTREMGPTETVPQLLEQVPGGGSHWIEMLRMPGMWLSRKFLKLAP